MGLTLLVCFVRLVAVRRGVTYPSLGLQYSCQRQLGVELSEAHAMACNGTGLTRPPKDKPVDPASHARGHQGLGRDWHIEPRGHPEARN